MRKFIAYLYLLAAGIWAGTWIVDTDQILYLPLIVTNITISALLLETRKPE